MLRHLLLDLDGTLIDSFSGIYYSFCLACKSLELQPPSASDFSCLIGPPVQSIAAGLYPHLDDASLECIREVFRDDYDQVSYRRAEWFPGVLEDLAALSSVLKLDLIIVTNKPTLPATELIKEAGACHLFSRIVGIDYRVVQGIGSVFRSKAEALSYVIASSSIELSNSVYLGDTIGDRDACKACNLAFIAALYGFHEWLPGEKPKWCLHQFCDIQSLLHSMFSSG